MAIIVLPAKGEPTGGLRLAIALLSHTALEKIETTAKFSVFLVLLFIGMCLSKMNILVLFNKLLTTFLPNSE